MRAFLICPVRGKEAEEFQFYVDHIEELGFVLHYPHRDTNQNDETGTGYRICLENRAAIEASDVVFIVWDGESQGSIFDLGMAFALRKRIVWLKLPEATAHKSFQNMIRHMNDQQKGVDRSFFAKAKTNMGTTFDIKQLYESFGEY